MWEQNILSVRRQLTDLSIAGILCHKLSELPFLEFPNPLSSSSCSLQQFLPEMGCVWSDIRDRFGPQLDTSDESDSQHCGELQSVEAQKQVGFVSQSFFNAVIEELFVVAERRWGAIVVIQNFSDCLLERRLQLYRQPQKAESTGRRLGMSYERGLFTKVFNPKREGHDGAVILQLFDGSGDFVPR